MTINTLDELTGAACNKAMEACVANLKRLGYTPSDISENADTILPMLRTACKAVLDEAVADFVKACESGAKRWAVTAFYVPFVAAGVSVASEFDEGWFRSSRLASLLPASSTRA
ncbi:MAG: hypothetical protein FJ284_12395 [Planctomycetes bacterium]|nr:hypothetical protein [Planctomycetota bacterium]